jgi:prepilin-type processing-associated H-X9-DG protein
MSEAPMPQASLPLFQDGEVQINNKLSCLREDSTICYFNWAMCVFSHHVDDHRSFKMITALFCANGAATQADICRAFGVTTISMKRYVKLYRDEGAAGFFKERTCRGPAVLTPDVLQEAQRLLDSGLVTKDVARKIGVKRDTLAKAIAKGKLRIPQLQQKDEPTLSTGSERNTKDADAPMGMGTTNTGDRMLARLGLLVSSVEINFEPCSDLKKGGVLCALPALIATGLLRHSDEFFSLPKGYYGLKSFFILLGFLALLRVKNMEGLRYEAPGEWGKMLGLDRIPEVRTMRKKVGLLADQDVRAWSAMLCKEWMQSDNESASVLYVDGHVRVYHGDQTKLPRHYVAREKLCLRATIDYWVNAMDGQPFFFVNKEVDPGLIKVLEDDIIPKLKELVPNQPSEKDLEDNPEKHRFTVVFDREGYSPALLKRLWEDERIACLTYKKWCSDEWPVEEFAEVKAKQQNGEVFTMKLAERRVRLGKAKRERIIVREIRKLTSGGKQVAIVTTDFVSDISKVAILMFARWSQENYFRYMRRHYSLDALANYDLEDVEGDVKVVNPKYRALEGEIRRLAATLARKRAEYGTISLSKPISEGVVETFQVAKSALKEEIDQLDEQLGATKLQRKGTPRKIKFSELPQEEKFKKLGTKSKHFIDTIKMIAYRAESAMVNTLRGRMSRHDDGRQLMASIYAATTDIFPRPDMKELHVRFHHLANAAEDRALAHLLEELNGTETLFPGTELKLVYSMMGSS